MGVTDRRDDVQVGVGHVRYSLYNFVTASPGELEQSTVLSVQVVS